MNPLIKWPGGKAGELKEILPLIPRYDRYIEPFFGGGALFFHLTPQNAAVNDLSSSLMDFYRLLKSHDPDFIELLSCYGESFQNLIAVCEKSGDLLLSLFFMVKSGTQPDAWITAQADRLLADLSPQIDAGFRRELRPDRDAFYQNLSTSVCDKLRRTAVNDSRRPFSRADLVENLITGFTGGYYTYFRRIFNALALRRMASPSDAYRLANFYFIREFCYGSMFRYNSAGEFNIPYGGMSYNRKNFSAKVEKLFRSDVSSLLDRTELHCADFEEFIWRVQPGPDDFIFLDPPYDTDFSDYEGQDFTHEDQERLAALLAGMPARFILVIKNTDFIRQLYDGRFRIASFDNHYTYNVRSRNERDAEHLIITNFE